MASSSVRPFQTWFLEEQRRGQTCVLLTLVSSLKMKSHLLSFTRCDVSVALPENRPMCPCKHRLSERERSPEIGRPSLLLDEEIETLSGEGIDSQLLVS